MRRLSALSALLLAPLLMAQTTAPAPPATVTDNAVIVLAMQPATFASEPQTATGGTAVLLTQQANVFGVVRVDAPVAGIIPVGNFSLSLEVRPGTELFPLALVQRQDAHIFCTTTVTTTTVNPLRPPIATRTCLVDTNSDRVFDYLGYIQVGGPPGRSVSGAWETQVAPRVSGGTATISTTQIASPVPYTPLQTHHIAPLTLELTARVVGETVTVDLRSREGEASAPVTDQRETVLKANMPATAALYGAQVEVQSLNEGVLTYRIVSAMPTEQPIALRGRARR